MNKPNDVICPHCNKKHGVSIVSRIPDKQKMAVAITSESPYIDAEIIGKTIINTTKILKGIAKEIGGKVSVFVLDIKVSEFEVKIEFFITTVKIRKDKP